MLECYNYKNDYGSKFIEKEENIMAARQPKNFLVSYCYIKDGEEVWVTRVNIEDITSADKLSATKLVIHPFVGDRLTSVTNVGKLVEGFQNITELFLPSKCLCINPTGKAWCPKLESITSTCSNFKIGKGFGSGNELDNGKNPLGQGDVVRTRTDLGSGEMTGFQKVVSASGADSKYFDATKTVVITLPYKKTGNNANLIASSGFSSNNGSNTDNEEIPRQKREG